MNNKFILLLFLILFIIFVFPSNTFALSDDVIDTRQAVYSIYDSFNSDMLVRVYNLSNGSTSQKYAYNQIINLFKNSDYSYFVTYKTWDGSDYYNSFAYNQSTLYLNFYKKYNLSVSSAPIDNWSLINTGMRFLTSSSDIISIEFLSDEVEIYTKSNSTFYLPNILVNYYPQTTIDFVSAINSNNNSLLQQIVNNSANTATSSEKIQEFLEDDSVPTSSDINSEISSNNNDYNNNITIPNDSNPNTSINTIISSFSSAFNYDNSLSTINIPIPFVSNKSLTLRSDIISSHIANTNLYTIIQLVYVFIFAKYFIRLSKRMLNWLDRGEAFTEGGFSKFLNYLSEQNVIINASLM